MNKVGQLTGTHAGQTMWVVGRGPSLEYLRAEHVGDGPVVAINQAVEVVERLGLTNPLYSMQKDVFFFHPVSAAMLVHTHESVRHYRSMIAGYDPAYEFDCETDFQIPWNTPSVAVCARLAEVMGCSKVVYLCCDAVTDGVIETFGEPATQPQEYLQHGAVVSQYARLPVEWLRIDN